MREVHFTPQVPYRSACGINANHEPGVFFSGSAAKPAVTCLDCQATAVYAAAKIRIPFGAPARSLHG